MRPNAPTAIRQLHSVDFTDVGNCILPNAGGVRHLEQLRQSKTPVANTVVSRRQSDYTNGTLAPVKLLEVDVTRVVSQLAFRCMGGRDVGATDARKGKSPACLRTPTDASNPNRRCHHLDDTSR